MEMEKQNNKNDKLQSRELEQVAGGDDYTNRSSHGNVNGPASEIRKKMGAKFKREWLWNASWTADLVDALVQTYGGEAANTIVHAYSRPQVFFGVAQNDGFHLDVLPDGM